MSNYCLDCNMEIPEPYMTMDDTGVVTGIIPVHIHEEDL